MALVPHKITALAESDAEGTDGKNIIAGAVVSLYDTNGAAVTLFDDENGNNGSTAKTTDATGQVVVYVTAGEYDEEVNGSVRRRVSVGGNSVTSYATTSELQSSRPNKTGQRAENRERANAQYELAASGYVALPGDITAANGRVWALQLGAYVAASWFGVSNVGDTSQSIQDCLDRASLENSSPNNGARVVFESGIYTCQGISLPPRVTLIGAGRNTSIFKLPDGASSDFIFADGGYVNNTTFAFEGITIRDCGFNGNKANNPSTKALFITKGYRHQFTNVAFSNSSGFGCLYTDTSANGTQNTSGLAENTWFKCYFDLNDRAGHYSDSSGSNQIADATISECIFNSNSLTAKEGDIYAERSAGFKILNNQLYGGGFHNIYLNSFSRGVVSGNHCDVIGGFADSGDSVAAIRVNSFSLGGASVINNNPIFIHVDAAGTGINPYGLILAGSTESLSVVGNSIGQYGNGGMSYNILGQQPQAIYNNSINDDVIIGSEPYLAGVSDANPASGSYTPTAAFFNVGDSVISYTTQQGYYTRVGKQVNFNARVTFNTNAYTTASGSLRLTLPFTAQDVGVAQNLIVGITQNINYSGGSEALSMGAYAINGQDKLELFISVDNATQQTVTTSQVSPSGTYTVYFGGSFLAE